MKNKKASWWILLVVTILAIIFLYVPTMNIFIQAVNINEANNRFQGFTLKWFTGIFENKRLFDSIKNTWVVALISTTISTILGTTFAIGIHFLRKKYKKPMLLINNIPMINADIVTAVTLLLVFTLLSIPFGMITMLLAHIFFSIPYVVIMVLPKLKRLDPNLFEAAIDLGCSRFMAVLKVIVPSIKTGIIAGALIAFTMSIDDFTISYFVKGIGFDNVSTWVYSILTKRTIPASAYAYNAFIIFITLAAIALYAIFGFREKKEK